MSSKNIILRFSKGIFVFSLIFTLVFSSYVSGVFGKTIDELSRELKYSKNKISDVYDKLKQYQEKLNEVTLQIDSIEGEIESIDGNINITDEVIKDTIYRIDAKKKSIKKASKDIVKQSMELESQKEVLTKIVEEMYTASEEGKSDLLEILLYSDNFNSAMNDVEYLDILHDQAKNSVDEIASFKDELEKKRLVLEEENSNLTQLLDSLESSKNVLESQTEAKKMLLDETLGKEEEYKKLKEEGKKALVRLNASISKIEDDLKSEKERLKKLQKINLGNGSLAWPADGKITAYFHDPSYPFIRILGQHTGIDIANKAGTVLSAANSGIVTTGDNGRYGYGKYVLITTLNEKGDTVSTLYGHLSKIYVSTGQEIKQGEAIGEIGSTGFSTGPHLHFEVRVNKVPQNPLLYLP